MTPLKDKIDNALDETRILILGSQVLLGLNYRAVFESGFSKLPRDEQYLKLVALILMALAVSVLVSTPAFHRIVEDGRESSRLHRYITRVAAVALVPLAAGFSIDLFVSAGRVLDRRGALAMGGGGALLAVFCWFGLAMIKRPHRAERKAAGEPRRIPTALSERIKNVLTELRVVLPGAQALLGFQFLAMLTEQFERLPRSGKLVHLASLAFVAVTTVFLIAPAAWHRIVEDGEDTERLHRVATRFLLAALTTLGIGMAGEIFVVVQKVTTSDRFAVIAAVAALVFFYALWFGYTLYRRSRAR